MHRQPAASRCPPQQSVQTTFGDGAVGFGGLGSKLYANNQGKLAFVILDRFQMSNTGNIVPVDAHGRILKTKTGEWSIKLTPTQVLETLATLQAVAKFDELSAQMGEPQARQAIRRLARENGEKLFGMQQDHSAMPVLQQQLSTAPTAQLGSQQQGGSQQPAQQPQHLTGAPQPPKHDYGPIGGSFEQEMDDFLTEFDCQANNNSHL